MSHSWDPKFVQIDAGPVLGTLPIAYRGGQNECRGHTAIALHELGGSSWSWGPLASALSGEYAIVAPDLPDAGLSGKAPSQYTLGDLAYAVFQFKQTLGLGGPVVVFGQAMGSVLAVEMALQFPTEVAGLVLVDGTSDISDQTRNYLGQRSSLIVQRGVAAVVDTTLGNAFRGFLPADDNIRQRIQDYRVRFMSNDPEAYVRNSAALSNYSFDEGKMREIAVPVLVATGEHDFIWPPSVGQALCSIMQNGQYYTVLGAAHFSAFQKPSQVASLIEPFWKDLCF